MTYSDFIKTLENGYEILKGAPPLKIINLKKECFRCSCTRYTNPCEDVYLCVNCGKEYIYIEGELHGC